MVDVNGGVRQLYRGGGWMEGQNRGVLGFIDWSDTRQVVQIWR